MWESLTIGLGVSATAILAALGGLLLLTALRLRQTPEARSIFRDDEAETVFLFDGQTLIDATPPARKLLSLGGRQQDAWTKLVMRLSSQFPDFSALIEDVPTTGLVFLSDEALSGAKDRVPMTVRAEWLSGLTRITLMHGAQELADPRQDGVVLSALTRDLADTNTILTKAPVLIWREDATGTLTWANAPYVLHAERELSPDENLRWPLPKLFDDFAASHKSKTGRRRLKTRTEDGVLWFDLVEIQTGGSKLIYAVPADSAVESEFALKEFMQTLTKTFAHLSTGLAIFDQHRRMQMFNPAMLDLTGLPVDFLAKRPTLYAFLDALRDSNMIPEPKNYRTWRERIIEIELAAEAGQFEETWMLPDGRIYRVMGRPHPNQALALVFDDISGEVSQTRHFRAEVAQSVEVLDSMEDAVILFGKGSHAVRTNAAYSRLWDHDATSVMATGGLGALVSDWQDITLPAKGLAKIRDFVAEGGAPNPASGEVRMNDGRSVGFRCVMLQDGSCLVIFRVLTMSLPFEVVTSRPVLKSA